MTAVMPYTPPVTAAGVDWATELEGARMLLKSGLAPQSLKTSEAALFVILVGRDLGLSPTQSLRSVTVIQGKVEIAADMQLALFKRSGGRAVWSVLTDAQATLDLAHPNGDAHRETFTMEDAKRAKLSGDNWTKYPKAMLRSRCITAAMKSVGFDVLAGVYAPGEIGGPEGIPSQPEPVSEAVAQLVTPQRANTQDAELVPEPAEPMDPETGEVLSGLDRVVALAQAFPLPFGKSKGTELGQMETENLASAQAWAIEKGKFQDFVDAAKIVLADRAAAAEARLREQGGKRLSFEEAHPALKDTMDDLPFS